MGRDLKFNQKADLQNDDLNKAELYSVVKPNIPQRVVNSRNKKRQWVYGYDEKYDVVIISKDGTIGEVYEINNLKIALPEEKTNG
jgi:dTDP-D-glucose 4,6-dehydratase